MPERSAKMKRRIFGVHRRGWWPKGHPRPDPAMCEMILCRKPSLGVILSEAKDRVGGTSEVPASLACPSRSFASLRMTRYRLPLAELEPLPRTRPARLLALDGARI